MAIVSREFTLTRAQKTVSVATAIQADWTWDERTVAQLLAAKSGTEGLLNQLAVRTAATNSMRGVVEVESGRLHEWTVKVLALARSRFREQPAKLRTYQGLTARGDSRAMIAEEGRALHASWVEEDAGGTYNLGNGLVLTEGMLLTQFRAVEGNDDVVPAVQGFYHQLENALQSEREMAETVNTAMGALATVMEAWYEAATTVWAPGTAIGNQVRGQIPTTYDPANPPLPLPATPDGLAGMGGPGTGEATGICLPAAYAEEYQWVLALPGQIPDVYSLTTTANEVLFTELPAAIPGTLTVTSLNATGSSTPSDGVSFTTGG